MFGTNSSVSPSTARPRATPPANAVCRYARVDPGSAAARTSRPTNPKATPSATAVHPPTTAARAMLGPDGVTGSAYRSTNAALAPVTAPSSSGHARDARRDGRTPKLRTRSTPEAEAGTSIVARPATATTRQAAA